MIGKRGKIDIGKGEVIILAPYFGPYYGMSQLANLKPVIVDTNYDFTPNINNIE